MEPKTATFFDLVREPLAEVEARMRTSPAKHHPDLEAALEHLLSSGGKRIRPTLVLLVGGMLQADRERIITLAAAIELLHTATLVHDDLIDGSLLRRGIPTLNAQWTPGATVLTGDYVFARAAHLAAQTESLEVMRRFAQTLMTIVDGEITQLFGSEVEDARQDYLRRIYAKTASLFELAAEGAALLSPDPEVYREPVRRFGYALGIAFQIVDDILDFVGEEQRVGKPVASDLRQGLITLPTLVYMETQPQDEDLERLLQGASLPESTILRLVDSIRASGAVDKALDEARHYVAQGLEALSPLPDTPERQALHELAEYVIQRQL